MVLNHLLPTIIALVACRARVYDVQSRPNRAYDRYSKTQVSGEGRIVRRIDSSRHTGGSMYNQQNTKRQNSLSKGKQKAGSLRMNGSICTRRLRERGVPCCGSIIHRKHPLWRMWLKSTRYSGTLHLHPQIAASDWLDYGSCA